MAEAQETQEPLKIFLDASVIVAAVLSPSGGSCRVFKEARMRGFYLITSRFAFAEAEGALIPKYSRLLDTLYNYASLLIFVDEPSQTFIERCSTLIDIKDAPVLAAALIARADFLLSLDRKHFLENQALGSISTIRVMAPGDFIKLYFIRA